MTFHHEVKFQAMSVKKINQDSSAVNSVTKSPGLKSTLNLPRTAFSMKANLPQSEPRQLAEWEEKGLYQRIQQARAGAEPYVLHDGPPYPTGTIHLGTGLNKILKDMVVKSKTDRKSTRLNSSHGYISYAVF